MLNIIDSTNLKPMATEQDIRRLCLEAKQYGFRGVCVHPKWVKYASEVLGKGSGLELISVVGFPLGCSTTGIKILEAEQAWLDGATEIDIVWDQAAFRAKHYLHVIEEIAKIRKVVSPYCKVKIIVEVANILKEDLATALSVVIDSGANCIKTSTGTLPPVDLVPIVRKWRKQNGKMMIKAAGGIHDFTYARHLLEAGVDILGTSSGLHFVKMIRKQRITPFQGDDTCL